MSTILNDQTLAATQIAALQADLAALATLASTLATQASALAGANLQGNLQPDNTGKRPSYDTTILNLETTLESIIAFTGEGRPFFDHTHKLKETLHRMKQRQHAAFLGVNF